ncbi:MAG: protein-disulfide reductase, partial [Proteobacteria bacterium]|nr:protein-disulfide reductase [Pseudomonadota bacterium]
MLNRFLPRLISALIVIAAGALPMGASSQIQLKTTASAGSSVVTTPQVRAELVAQAPQGVGPGKPLQLGLLLTHQRDWHTYWKNPGDSGLPTQLEWRLPAGMDAGEIAWPVPRKIPIGHLANYGYEGTTLLPVPVTVSPAFNPGPLTKEVTIALKASWLVCRQECIPEDGEFTLQLPIQGTTALHAAAFDAAARAFPQDLPAAEGSSARVDEGAVTLRVAGLPSALQGQKLEVFPETMGVVETAATPQQRWDGALWTARLPLSRERSEGPEPMPVVLAHGGQGWRLQLPVDGGWPALAPLASMSPALAAALKANAANAQPPSTAPTPAPLAAWLLALAGALLGGLVLNLMPCVFPVLAIKVLGFARHAQDARAHRISGLAYTAGVLLSFLALGALMLALRAAGEAVGWGFQLQSPAVVALLAALFTLIALNL